MTFFDKLQTTIKNNNSLLCVGLDPDYDKLPEVIKATPDPVYEFNRQLIDKTHDLVCAYKPNIAFYESSAALSSLKKTVEYIQTTYPEIPIICDAKRGDIASTSTHYAQSLFEHYMFDAVTVNPYLGFDSLVPFLQHKDKGIIILCRTSNPSATDFQDLMIDGNPLFIHVAKKIAEWSKEYPNCLMVVGATWPEQLKQVRDLAPDITILVPGVGSQGGDLEGTVKAGLKKDNTGLIINAGRSIIYAGNGSDFAEKARVEALKTRDHINVFRR